MELESRSSYHALVDITASNAKLIEEVNPDLVVFNVDHRKSYVPIESQLNADKRAALDREERLKRKLSINFGGTLLDDKGWANGTRLPFADRENQELEKLLEIRQRKFLAVQTELIDNDEHLKMLEENFSRTSQDIATHSNLLASKKKQVEEERDLLSLAERICSKFLRDKVVTEKTMQECKDRCDRMQVNQERRLQNLCELRDLIEFDRESLKDYQERLKDYQSQKHEIGRIIDEDAKAVEHIDKMYDELGANRKLLKTELDTQAMVTQKSQEQLDLLSVEFRRLYRHRQDMLQLWTTNIESAKRRDNQMQEVAEEYFEMKEAMRDMTNEMEFRERQYRQMQCSIRSNHFHISEMDKKVGEMRRVVQEEKDVMIQLKDAIIDIQMDVRRASVEERKMAAQSATVDEEFLGIQEKLVRVRATVEENRLKLREVTDLRNTSDSHVTDLENILDEEYRKTEVLLREIEITRLCFWERSNDKKKIITSIAQADMSIIRCIGNLSTLEAKEISNMEFLARQSGKVYRMDLESSALENKIAHSENEAVNPQYFVYQTEVTDLKASSKKLAEEKKYISKQIAYLDQVIVKNGNEMAKHREEKNKLNTELLQINMVSQRTQKLTIETDKEFQDAQVTNSLETVNLKRLTDAIRKTRDHLFGLSEQRATIQSAVSERKAEIETKRALNTSKLKALMDTTDKLRVQSKEMVSRTVKLRGRFELITKMMMDAKSNETEEETIAFRVRKAARERESLQVEMRKWEKRIEEANQELEGLENVQKLLHASNIAVKEKLTPLEQGSTEAEELEVLEHEEKAIHVRKNRAIKFKSVLAEKIEQLKQQKACMDQEIQATSQVCKMKTAMASKTENELIKQKEKVQRWSALCVKLLREIKPIIKADEYDVLQQDLKLKLVQERLECAFTMLDKLVTTFPIYFEVILEYFENSDNLQSMVQRLIKSFNTKGRHSSGRVSTNREPSNPAILIDENENTRVSTDFGDDDSSEGVTRDERTRSSMGEDEGSAGYSGVAKRGPSFKSGSRSHSRSHSHSY